MSIKVVIDIGEYVKVIETFYTRVVIWVDTILNHIDIRMVFHSISHSILMILVHCFTQGF
jgi:hypothetical protein